MKSWLKIKACPISDCPTLRVYHLKTSTKDKFIILWKIISKKFPRQKGSKMLYLKLTSKNLIPKIVTIAKRIQRLKDQFGTKCKFTTSNSTRVRFKKGSNSKKSSSKQCETTSQIRWKAKRRNKRHDYNWKMKRNNYLLRIALKSLT